MKKEIQKSIRLTMSEKSYDEIKKLRHPALTLGKSLVFILLEEVNKRKPI